MKRIIRLLAVTVVMAAIVLASVVPAFAAIPTYDCFDSTGALIAEGFDNGQAKQVETNNPDPGAYCLQRIP